jgi:transposase
MIRIFLTPQEKTALTQLRLHRKSSIGERAYYVLLAADGKSPPEIAEYLKRSVITIRLWLGRYLNQGMTGLKTKKQPGRPAKKAPVIEENLKELLSHSPKDYGYQEAGWQVNILRDLFSKQGCIACDNTIVKSLNKLGFVYKRFSKTLPKNTLSSSEKNDKIENMVEAIKNYPSKETEILFVDESHFSNQPYVSRGWFRRGEKKW